MSSANFIEPNTSVLNAHTQLAVMKHIYLENMQ